MINYETFAVITCLRSEGHMQIVVEQTHGLTLDEKLDYLCEYVCDMLDLKGLDYLAYVLISESLDDVNWIAVAREVDKYRG